jgi:hypothetical protein
MTALYTALLAAVAALALPTAPPAGLTAQPFYTSVRLTWQPAPAARYAVERTDSLTAHARLAYTARAGFTDCDLSPDTLYAYRVAAVDQNATPAAWSPELYVRTRASGRDLLWIATHDLLYVIYSGGMAQDEVDRLTLAVARDGREFFWRNSLLRYNLNVTTMVIPTYPPDTEGPTMANIEADLRSRGVQDNQYDAVFVTGNGLAGCYGGFVILGETGGAYSRVCGVPSPYEGLSDTDATVVWGFTHEFGHVLDLILCDWSGHPEMLFNHFPWAYPLPPGIHFDASAHFDGMGEILAVYDAYDDFRAPWDGYVEVVDADGDGVPDDDSRVPMDEARFGSSPALEDTDDDGLSDFGEMTAGRYAYSDPTNVDTDGDGLHDGGDPWPLVTISPWLYHADADPVVDGQLDSSYYLLSTGHFFSKDAGLVEEIWACWRDDALYFLVRSNRRPRVWINLDGSAENGRWDSGGRFAESGNLYTDEAYGDCYAEDGVLLAQDGTPLLYKRGQAVPGSAVDTMLASSVYNMEIRVPTELGPGASYSYFRPDDPLITGITLTEGKLIGLNFTIAAFSSSSTNEYSGNWATVGETYHFYDVELAAAPAALRGLVTLQQYQDPEGHTAMLQFRRQATTTVLFECPIVLDADSHYRVSPVPTGMYDLALKFPHFLRQVIENKPIYPGDNFAAFILTNGDADGNNVVDLADLNVILTRFGTADTMPDLDGSGLVDLPDLNIALLSFGKEGVP